MNRLLLCVTTVTLTKAGFMESCVIDLRRRPPTTHPCKEIFFGVV